MPLSENEVQTNHLKRKRLSEDQCTPEPNQALVPLSVIAVSDSKRNTSVRAFNRAKHLRIEIPPPLDVDPASTSPTSLFSLSAHSEKIPAMDCLIDEISDSNADLPLPVPDRILLARRSPPPIPGLFFSPSLCLPCELTDSVMLYCQETYFKYPDTNQVMLFGRLYDPPPDSGSSKSTQSSQSISGLPTPLLELLDTLSVILRPVLPSATYDLLFPLSPTMARQAIINLYHPGEGISPHVDLLGRYADGIIGVSFGSGTVMRFDNITTTKDDDSGSTTTITTTTSSAGRDADDDRRWDVYLPERSIIILSESARYEWTHGIEKRKHDYVSLPSASIGSVSVSTSTSADVDIDTGIDVDPELTLEHTHTALPDCQEQWIERGIRMSVTFRWLLPGADVVGEDG